MGVTVNAIRAGVTDTPAFRKIPGSEYMAEQVRTRNPSGRMTEPSDVAAVIAMLAGDEAQWITGTVLGVERRREHRELRSASSDLARRVRCLDRSAVLVGLRLLKPSSVTPRVTRETVVGRMAGRPTRGQRDG